MRILITGGNGFLGSSIVRKAVHDGHEVFVFSMNSDNISDLMDKVVYRKASNKDLIKHKHDVELFQPDIFVHCGWSGGNNYINIDSLSQFEDNVKPTIDFLSMLSTLPKLPKFVGFGSFAEYGIQDTNTLVETSLTNPTSLYGLSKQTVKQYSELLCRLWNMDWLWIRPCYVYGPNDVPSRIIPKLIRMFTNNEAVILDSCNSNIDYVYIDDFTKLVYKLIVTDAIGVYNISSGTTINIKQLVLKIRELLGSSSLVEFNNRLNRVGVSRYLCGDPTKVLTQTGLTIDTPFEVGLEQTIDFFKNKQNER